MKYLKLFENFNEEPYIEEAKWIIISHLGEVEEIEIDPKWNAKDILKLKLDQTPDQENIDWCKKHLEEEGFFLNIKKDVCTITTIPVTEYCIKWLNENFSNLEVVQSKEQKDWTLYRYVVKDNILIYDRKTSEVYINYDKIWSFFESYFYMEYTEIQALTQEWLSETYKLKDVTTIFGSGLFMYVE